MYLNPTETSLRARAAAHMAHAKHGSQHMTAAARRSFAASFEAKVDHRANWRRTSGHGAPSIS